MAVTGTPSQMPPQDDHHFQQNRDQNLHQEKLPEKDAEGSGTSPELIAQNNDAGNLLPPPAPMNRHRRSNKRGRKTTKHKRPPKKLKNLMNDINPIPFIPKTLNLRKHEEVLKRLGLYSFSNLDLDREIRTDLLAQLIVNYDQKKKCSYVNGHRIKVNRAAVAKALMLPAAKQHKGNSIMDTEVFSNEVIGFVEDFIFNFMLLHEESWELPVEIVNWTSCIRDGHPEKLDPASLIWYKVEKELNQGGKLVDCYYASHLQLLIRSQREDLFMEDAVDDDNAGGVQEDDDVVLCLGPEAVKMVHQEVGEGDETMVETEECKEEEVEKQGNWKNDSCEQILQRCHGTDLNGYEEIKVGEDEGVQTEHAEDVEEDERFVAGFDMTPFQGMETSHVPCGSSVDLTRARDDSLMSRGGKSLIEVEEDTHQHDDNRKRLETVEMWDQKQTEQSDFGVCMVQMQEWVGNAKMIHQSQEQHYVNLEVNHRLAIKQLQDHQQIMEMIMKSKDEALKKKQTEVVRLERELYLMEDLLAGYRKALNDSRVKFSEYRKRFPIKEEPLYKDAGPGGLVLSTQELENWRLKMMKFQTFARNYEQECIYQMHIQFARVLKMWEKVVFLGNEVGRLKEMATKRKMAQKPEENQKSVDEIPKDVLSTESVPLDAHGLQEKGGCEEH